MRQLARFARLSVIVSVLIGGCALLARAQTQAPTVAAPTLGSALRMVWRRIDKVDPFTKNNASVFALASDTSPVVTLSFVCEGGKLVQSSPSFSPSTPIRTGFVDGHAMTLLWSRIDGGKNVRESQFLDDNDTAIKIPMPTFLRLLKSKTVTIMYEDRTPSPVVATFSLSGLNTDELKATCKPLH